MSRAARLSIAWLSFLLALAAIAGAWGFQLIGGYVPCKLCLEQRIPFYVGLPVLAAAAIAMLFRAPLPVARVLLAVAGLIFLAGLGLAVYHSGVEWQWWMGPSDCGGGVATTTDAGNLLSQIGQTKVVSCSEAAWRLFGLSFAGWNAVVSAIVAFLLLRAGLAGADD